MIQAQSKYRWYVLGLGTLTHIFVVAMARMGMPVLFAEIAQDLGLDLLQVGTIWGMIGLAGLCTALAYGMVGDRYGTGLTLGVACMLSGAVGASRGLSAGFTSLAVIMFIYGIVGVPLSFTTHKAAAEWFSGKQLGLANGILAMGMGLGVTLGSILNATTLSPLLGGWRNLLFVYGAIAVVIGFLWLRAKRRPDHDSAEPLVRQVPFREALSHVVHVKAIWLLAVTNMFIGGSGMAFIGYLPLYLRGQGWTDFGADGALATLSAAGMIGAVPISWLSDKIGLRKAIIYGSMFMNIAGMGLMAFLGTSAVWPAVAMMGLVREGLYAVILTLSMESEGIGATYAGTALGLMTSISQIGSFLSPPIGNSLAAIKPNYAFTFWMALSIMALASFFFVRETGWKKTGALLKVKTDTI